MNTRQYADRLALQFLNLSKRSNSWPAAKLIPDSKNNGKVIVEFKFKPFAEDQLPEFLETYKLSQHNKIDDTTIHIHEDDFHNILQIQRMKLFDELHTLIYINIPQASRSNIELYKLFLGSLDGLYKKLDHDIYEQLLEDGRYKKDPDEEKIHKSEAYEAAKLAVKALKVIKAVIKDNELESIRELGFFGLKDNKQTEGVANAIGNLLVNKR